MQRGGKYGVRPDSDDLSWLERGTELVAWVAKVYGHVTKVGYPLLVFAGLILLWAFTRRAAIPFPQPDGTRLGFAVLLAVASWLIVTLLGCLSFMPMVSIFIAKEMQLLPSEAVWPTK
jgi:hypothetical protein